MALTWGGWRTRTVAAGLIGAASYFLILLAGDLWAAEVASHDPPCFDSCYLPPSFFEVVGLQASSFILGVIAIVAVLEFADRRVVRTPRGLERFLLALAATMVFLPGLPFVGLASPRAVGIAIVLGGPPVVIIAAYLVGPPPAPAPFAVRHPFLARVPTPPFRTRITRAGRSLVHLFVPYPMSEPSPTTAEVRPDLFTTTPDEDASCR